MCEWEIEQNKLGLRSCRKKLYLIVVVNYFYSLSLAHSPFLALHRYAFTSFLLQFSLRIFLHCLVTCRKCLCNFCYEFCLVEPKMYGKKLIGLIIYCDFCFWLIIHCYEYYLLTWLRMIQLVSGWTFYNMLFRIWWNFLISE